MKFATTLFALYLAVSVYSQSSGTIMVRAGESGSSEEVDLELFQLNHVLYWRAFITSDIYSSVSSKSMAVVTKSIQANLSQGKRTYFMIATGQKVAYTLSVAVFKNKETDEMGLVLLTNFNAEKGKFEKKTKDENYALWCPLEGSVVTGSFFGLSMEDEEKYLEQDDYISLIYLHVFNALSDSAQINKWFTLSEETQSDKINNRNFLKSYYHLSQYNFSESEKWLEELKKSVATFSIQEQNHWKPIMKNLTTEIETLKEIKEG